MVMSTEKADLPAAGLPPLPLEDLELSVVMPCLNEHETVGTCVEKSLRAIRQAGISGEVIVADNGSSDGSVEIAQAAGARVVPVSLKGYGNALMGGIQSVRFTIIDRLPMAKDFRTRIRTPRMKLRLLVLRRFRHFAEHFAG